jgi:hypothetical protein
MTYQMTLTLSDEEYAELSRESVRRGTPIEALIHELIARGRNAATQPHPTMTSREFLEKQYREGKVANLPSRQALSAEEQAERERLARKLAGGKPASEMAIEDRGPR